MSLKKRTFSASSRFSLLAITIAMACSVPVARSQPGGVVHKLVGKDITVEVRTADGKEAGLRVRSLLSAQSIALPELFTIVLHDGTKLTSSSLRTAAPIAED